MFFRRITAAVLCTLLLAASFTGCSGDSSGMASTGSVIINEIMSSNSAFAPAGDGGYYDWIELYNPTSETIDLNDCYLTDNDNIPMRFRLRDLIIEPGQYTIVYLSGLNGIDTDGYLHADFKLSSQGETVSLNDKYGNILSRVEMPSSPRNVSYGRLDESISVSYEWFASPTPLARNEGEHAADPDKLNFSGNGVIINEFMTDNTYTLYDIDGDYNDWVELYNPTDTDADMSGYSLSDSSDDPSKWVFPYGTVIPAGGYLLIYCDGKNMTDAAGALHTSFSLSPEDNGLYLFSNQNFECSSFNIPDMPSNVSCGYMPDDPGGDIVLFARATPGQPNPTAGFELTAAPSPDINRGILISEVLSVSSTLSEYSSDFIEIFNATSEDIDLGGYTLAQTPGEVVFTFPPTTLAAGSCIVIYCDGTESSDSEENLHAPIKINSGGEDFFLAEPDGRICDYFASGKGDEGVSSGRIGSDPSVRYFFTTPSPGKPNSANGNTGYAMMPAFSHEGGYVDAGTQISITAPDGCHVFYTTDGSIPTLSSAEYTAPLTIDSTTVLRAVAAKDGLLNSQCVTQTYLVEERHSISVVSLSSDPDGLFSDETGIMVTGDNDNYTQDWEREVHIEYFDEDGIKCVEFDAGAKIFGQYSRTEKQKGLRLALREIYGANEVTYPFFPNSISGVTSFSNLLLRPSGQDQQYSCLRDELVPAIIRGHADVDYQEYRACALYINSEYWGLYYIRERLDADYLQRKYGFQEGTFDLIKSQSFAQAGTKDAWSALDEFCEKNDLTIEKNYEYVCSQVDLDSLIDFWIIETYFSNADSGNIRCYKTAEGKWRWMIYDFDWALFDTTWDRNYIYYHLLEADGHGAANFSNALMRNLLRNSDFRDKFISRYCYHLNNTFDPERTLAILDEMIATIKDEVPRQRERWNQPTVSRWDKNIETIRYVLEHKPEIAIKHLKASFGLTDREINRYLKENK